MKSSACLAVQLSLLSFTWEASGPMHDFINNNLDETDLASIVNCF
jgi:hypothetical protein